MHLGHLRTRRLVQREELRVPEVTQEVWITGMLWIFSWHLHMKTKVGNGVKLSLQ